MLDQQWDGPWDGRRAARPVVLCVALGTAAFALTFSAALLLGRGLAGSALAALLLPLALSGAAAVALAVTFVVAVALDQVGGTRRVAQLVMFATPLAALVALFVYASHPTAGTPLADVPPVVTAPAPRTPRIVSVPPAPPVRPVPPTTAPVAPVARGPVVVAGPVAPVVAPAAPAPVVEAPEPAETPRPGPRVRPRTTFRPAVFRPTSAPEVAEVAKAHRVPRGKALGHAKQKQKQKRATPARSWRR